jgi:hypothetical protein
VCVNHTHTCQNHTRVSRNYTRACRNYTLACQKHTLRVKITIVYVDITLVYIVITFVRVKITLCMWKSQFACWNHTCTGWNHSRQQKCIWKPLHACAFHTQRCHFYMFACRFDTQCITLLGYRLVMWFLVWVLLCFYFIEHKCILCVIWKFTTDVIYVPSLTGGEFRRPALDFNACMCWVFDVSITVVCFWYILLTY